MSPIYRFKLTPVDTCTMTHFHSFWCIHSTHFAFHITSH